MSLFKGQVNQPEEDRPPIPEEENEVLEKVARKVVQWRMAVPAIIFLESVKPLNYIGSQVMVFFEPIVQSLFNFKYYDAFRAAMERRENVENLLQKIEKYDAEQYEWEKRVRKFMRAEKKKWRWYQRYLGIRRPKVVFPEELHRKSPGRIDGR
ncbi:MAG: hypothetical protein JSV44_03460 [Candidatus Zixiibacteriota bacterium]|nr:MAG: hypothetical protein JSV44_03460 [candidate division Zixibacteria bacterium]